MNIKLCSPVQTLGRTLTLTYLLFLHSRPPQREWAHLWLPAFHLSLDPLKLQTSLPSWVMEKVQYLTRSAIRRASTIEVPQQARQNLQNLFINFCLILICLLLICIIVMLLWSPATSSVATDLHQLKRCHPMKRGKQTTPHVEEILWKGEDSEEIVSKCIHLLDLVTVKKALFSKLTLKWL